MMAVGTKGQALDIIFCKWFYWVWVYGNGLDQIIPDDLYSGRS